METQLTQMEERITRASKVWESAGGYSPTVGIIGAVLGLIQVMQNLSDPSKLGAGIAVAFVATVYGVGAANLVFIPLSSKMKLKSKQDFLAKEMIIEGILSIQAGESPALIERKLQSFLIDKPAQSAQGATKTAQV
jgi:chemotaxis protein MotA